ncbi:MAG: Ig-like domain-containing protein, partial [Actinomycetota bacterium]
TRRCALTMTALALLGSLVSGCSAVTPSAAAEGAARPAAGAASSSSSTSTMPPAQIAVTPADGTTGVRPDAPVRVTASGGPLTDVAVVDGDGDALDGELAADKATWTSSGPLTASQTYTVTATATNAAGAPATVTSTLGTLKPKDSADYYLLPSGSGQVGVGMPVVVQFLGLVDADKQAAIEKHVSVTTSPAVKGAWGWLDARQLIWRPATYWAPGTKVKVTADIAGIETRAGIWTKRNASTSFSIGSATISTVDVAAHTLTVRRNGAVLRTIPVTTGKKGYETRSGVKVVISRESSRQMDAETTGLAKTDPDYYNVNVKYAMRLTWSGEFLHAAPWSVGSQGRANVSHGCTGMSTANAKWLFESTKMGDVVKYVNSRRPLESYNGYTMWNMSLAQWATHSALA